MDSGLPFGLTAATRPSEGPSALGWVMLAVGLQDPGGGGEHLWCWRSGTLGLAVTFSM